MKIDWNYERYRTRDRLLEYDFSIVPPHPHSAGLAFVYPLEEHPTAYITNIPPTIMPFIYPWENTALSVLLNQLYTLALQGGFVGTPHDFLEHFASFSGERQIVFDNYENFPAVGYTNKLYFDLNENILYYFDNDYIPVNAMLIANTTIDGGEA